MSRKNNNDTPRLFEVEEYFRPQRKEVKSYEEFINKFKPINGSDECYTPPPVFECVGNGCYVREGVLPRINSDINALTGEELLYLHHNNFKPIC